MSIDNQIDLILIDEIFQVLCEFGDGSEFCLTGTVEGSMGADNYPFGVWVLSGLFQVLLQKGILLTSFRVIVFRRQVDHVNLTVVE